MIRNILHFAIICGFAVALGVTAAAAQAPIMLPSGVPLLPPPPAPIPPPRTEVPVVPQVDSLPAAPRAQRSSRKSFGDRITDCLQDSSAAGLDSSARAGYSRACANR